MSNERVFVLAIDEQPIVAFEAGSILQAKELTNEQWLKDDLGELRSEGKPLWSNGNVMSVRNASANEMSLYWQARDQAEPSDEILLAYLIDIDEN